MSDWSDFQVRWEKYGVNKESCLEIGCGAGRITKHLAGYFNEVHALDVSEKMIEYARNHMKSPFVVFHLSKGVHIPLNDQSVYSVFSTHVFQHLDSLSVAKYYFEEIARVLKPGGTLMIHLPIYKWPSMSWCFRPIYDVRTKILDVQAVLKRILMKSGMIKPIMRNLKYPLDFFYQEFPKLGLSDIEIAVFVTRSNNSPPPICVCQESLKRNI
jgi:ubiquinone/menaquinone biosynthesis C-methylase UbiE